tara:strand:- start:19 stop:273 length:255 start_codon:yes stop_codon:yes gene_type:complete
MKTKHLAMENGDLTGSSIGDQMSAMAEEGWLEYELMVSIKAYMLSNDFRNGCSFAKKIEVMALKIWTDEVKEKSKRLNAHGLPF